MLLFAAKVVVFKVEFQFLMAPFLYSPFFFPILLFSPIDLNVLLTFLKMKKYLPYTLLGEEQEPQKVRSKSVINPLMRKPHLSLCHI